MTPTTNMLTNMLESPAKLNEAVAKLTTNVQKMAEKQALRVAFNKAAFNVETNPTTEMFTTEPMLPNTSKQITQAQLDHRLYVLKHWEKGTDDIPVKTFRKQFKNVYKNWKDKFTYTNNDDGTSTMYHVASNTKLVPCECIFDVVYDYHYETHAKAATLKHIIQQVCYTITFSMIEMFCKLCPICASKQPITKPHKGAVKVIETLCFRDRYIADLVDFQRCPAPLYPWDPENSPTMKWLLVIKDHFTRFVYLTALPTKHADHVAAEVAKFFALFGYPLVWHTDNGKEFIAEIVMKIIRELLLFF
jgi:hypothetical protein